jgi:hypothetical protein
MRKLNGSADGWSARLWLLGALVVGLVIGLVLAWQVIPTRWVDTDPSDLRAEHQTDYVALVADSWTVSGDADLARERLYELVDQDTTWADVDALVAQTAAGLSTDGNGPAALRVTRMRDTVPLPVDEDQVVAVPVEEEKPAKEASPQPAATVKVAPAEEDPEEGKGIGWLPIVGLLAVLGAAAAIAFVVIRDRRRAGTPDAGDVDFTTEPTMEDRRRGSAVSLNPLPTLGGIEEQLASDDETITAEVDLQGEADDAAEDALYEEAEEAPLSHMPALEPEEAWHIETAGTSAGDPNAANVQRPVEISPLGSDDLEAVEEAPTGEILTSRTWPRRASASEPALSPGQLGIFETSYAFGDDDFYHAFTVESPTHEFLGQCGIVISDVLGLDEGQLVDAFDIWLFETQGTRTLSKVLVSEHASRDEGISAKLVRKGELVVVRPGLVVELETESIRLTATVQDVAYRKDAPVERGVFDRLKIRMVVEQLS